MTLKGKNRFTFMLSIFFLGLSIFFLVYFILKMNAESQSTLGAANSIAFTSSAWTAIFSSFCLMAFVPVAAFFAYSHFIKTPSMEIVYFMLFCSGVRPACYGFSPCLKPRLELFQCPTSFSGGRRSGEGCFASLRFLWWRWQECRTSE